MIGRIALAAALICTPLLGGQQLVCFDEFSDDASVKMEVGHQDAASPDWNYVLKFTYYQDERVVGWWRYEETEDLRGDLVVSKSESLGWPGWHVVAQTYTNLPGPTGSGTCGLPGSYDDCLGCPGCTHAINA